MFIPVILGSDKTTVSVTTGQNEYYPLYISNGVVTNSVRRAHKNAVSLLGFLAIPKSKANHLCAFTQLTSWQRTDNIPTMTTFASSGGSCFTGPYELFLNLCVER